jgi:RHS repeat-associated protein
MFSGHDRVIVMLRLLALILLLFFCPVAAGADPLIADAAHPIMGTLGLELRTSVSSPLIGVAGDFDDLTWNTVSGGVETRNYTYNSMNQLRTISGSETSTFDYDYFGNLTRRTKDGAITDFAYDILNRQKSMTLNVGTQNAEQTLYSYYGPTWMRKTMQVGTGPATSYLHDGFACVSQTTAGVKTNYFVPGTTPLWEKTNNQVLAYAQDGRGNITGLWNGNNYAAKFNYDAFGNVKTTDAANNPLANTSGPRYGGQFHDANTDQIYLRNRYYDPKIGAFNRIDPIGFNGGLNLYGYCGGDGVNRADPMGTDYIEIGKGGVVYWVVTTEHGHAGEILNSFPIGKLTSRGMEEYAIQFNIGTDTRTHNISREAWAEFREGVESGKYETPAGMKSKSFRERADAVAAKTDAFIMSQYHEIANSVQVEKEIRIEQNLRAAHAVEEDLPFYLRPVGRVLYRVEDSLSFGRFSNQDRIQARLDIEDITLTKARSETRWNVGIAAAATAGAFVGAGGNAAAKGAAVNRSSALVRTNAELVQEISKRADAWGVRKALPQFGSRSGSLKHGYADRLLTRYQKMFGDRGLSTEVRYSNGQVWQTGMPVKGSIKLDVVEGDLISPSAVYDYKFGGARLKEPRIFEIRTGANLGVDIPVLEVRP